FISFCLTSRYLLCRSFAQLGLHSFPPRRSSDLHPCFRVRAAEVHADQPDRHIQLFVQVDGKVITHGGKTAGRFRRRRKPLALQLDRKSTRLNSSHVKISYAVFCLKKKNFEATIT